MCDRVDQLYHSFTVGKFNVEIEPHVFGELMEVRICLFGEPYNTLIYPGSKTLPANQVLTVLVESVTRILTPINDGLSAVLVLEPKKAATEEEAA